MNNPDFEATTFEDLVYSILDGEETVYGSPWIGEEEMNTVIEAADEVVMSGQEGLYTKEYEDRENVRIVESLESYTRHRYGGSSGLDGEFVAPPGTFSSEIRENPEKARELVNSWAKQTNEAVNDEGFSFYSDKMWSDARIAPLRKSEYNIQAEDMNMDTRFILADYFDRVEEVEGEDYSGVLATRE